MRIISTGIFPQYILCNVQNTHNDLHKKNHFYQCILHASNASVALQPLKVPQERQHLLFDSLESFQFSLSPLIN